MAENRLINFLLVRAEVAAEIFAQKEGMSSKVCAREVPNKLFCFKPHLYSMMHALTPISSRARTVKRKISGWPPENVEELAKKHEDQY